MRCTDPGRKMVARIEVSEWNRKQKAGRIELLEPSMGGGMTMDEIVVSGIAMCESRRRKAKEKEAVAEGLGGLGELVDGGGGGGDGGGGGGAA